MANLNDRSVPRASPALLERDSELTLLGRYLNDAQNGQGNLVLIGAEAGAGKTALVRAFRETANGQAQVLIGACDALSTPQPLGPLLDVVQHAGPELQRLIAGASSGRQDLYHAFLGWLDTQREPVAIVFEDLHWADAATLDLLRFLGRRIEPTGTLLIATYRNDEVGPLHPFRITIGDLATMRAMHRIRLEPLTREAVASLAESTSLDPAELHRQTGGNPFYVTEVIASGGNGVPATVRDAVLARAARLSPAARRSLDAAAVIGARVERPLLSRLLDDGADPVSECVAAGVLIELGPDLGFRHDIVRDAVLEAMPTSEEHILHEAALAALREREDDPVYLARLAHHAEAAGDREAVLEYAPQAAGWAASVNSHSEAAAQYERALRFAGSLPPAERASLLERYAQECYLANPMNDAVKAHGEAARLWRAAGNSLKEGENLSKLARVLVYTGRTAESEDASRESIAVLEAQPPGAELASAYQMQAHLRMFNRDNDEAVERGEQAIELAERLGAEEVRIYAYNTVGTAMLFSEIDDGIGYLEQSLNLAREAGFIEYVVAALDNLGTGTAEMYDFELADKYLSEGIAYADEHGIDCDLFDMLTWQAFSHLYQGRWSEAADVAGSVVRRPGVAALSRIMALLALGRVRTRRGDPGVWQVLDEALDLAAPMETLQRLAPAHAARAEAAWLAGDNERTRKEARASFDLAVQHKHPWHIGELGYWRWKAGDLDSPPDLAAEPFALQIAGDWQAAAASWRALNCPYEAARALAESDDEGALRQALEAFDKLGAAPARAEVAQRLREIGARSIPRGARPSTRANPAGLTRRQVEVARLVVEGCGNAEIAERLFISSKTVEHHVSALFAKLGVDNRIEAAREAARLDLIPSDPTVR